MGRMSDLHIELQERGLTDEEIQNYDYADLDFNNRDAPPGEQWWTEQDNSNFAEKYEAERIKAEITDWRLFGAM